jgi:hypothetical protein
MILFIDLSAIRQIDNVVVDVGLVRRDGGLWNPAAGMGNCCPIERGVLSSKM